jgi:hypothetical protein
MINLTQIAKSQAVDFAINQLWAADPAAEHAQLDKEHICAGKHSRIGEQA